MAEFSKHMLGHGAYFLTSDYVGLMPRVAILIVDVFTLALFYTAAGAAFVNLDILTDDQFLWFIAISAWLYMTVLKASRFRTVGYWLLGARIVDLNGGKPSLLRMTFRFLLCVFGPFSLIFDLLWVSTDQQRQTLRDRYAGTCVVKHRAEPVGRAEIRLVSYHALGFNLMYQQVMQPKS